MDKLSKKIEFTINEIILKLSGQNEVLIGKCPCGDKITNTQKHILMLLKDEDITNKDLALKLNISQAAITKAIKILIKEGMIVALKDINDARVLRYKLSNEAKNIADKHKDHHKQTLLHLNELVSAYSSEEREVISRFLDDLSLKLRG